MDYTCIIFDGVKKYVPIIGGQALHMPHNGYDDFDTYCGAGEGIGDLIVPDDIYELPISVDCFIHDKSWRFCEPTWEAFNYSNWVFHRNIVATIDHFQPAFDYNDRYRSSRYSRAALYYTFVQSGAGPAIFWHMKKQQDPSTWRRV